MVEPCRTILSVEFTRLWPGEVPSVQLGIARIDKWKSIPFTEDLGVALSAAPVGTCGVQILSLGSGLLYYRNVTRRSHIDIRQFETLHV